MIITIKSDVNDEGITCDSLSAAESISMAFRVNVSVTIKSEAGLFMFTFNPLEMGFNESLKAARSKKANLK